MDAACYTVRVGLNSFDLARNFVLTDAQDVFLGARLFFLGLQDVLSCVSVFLSGVQRFFLKS